MERFVFWTALLFLLFPEIHIDLSNFFYEYLSAEQIREALEFDGFREASSNFLIDTHVKMITNQLIGQDHHE